MGLFCWTALNLDERSYLSTKEEDKVFGQGAKLRLIKITFLLCFYGPSLDKCLRGVSPVPRYLYHLGERAEGQWAGREGRVSQSLIFREPPL